MEKTAFIAIVGRPNVGKSSILNEMIGQKVAIVSSKPQTTRTRIMGIVTENDTQLVFIDTPGLHKPVNELGKYMVKSVNESVSGVDACLLVVEAGKPISHADEDLISRFKSLGLPAILAINKIDLVNDKTEIMQQILNYNQKFDFEAIVPVCAKNGNAIGDLKDELKKIATEGNYFFDEDELTDQPEKVLASEMVREKLLRLLDKEIPHGTAVVVERMRTREDTDIMDVEATIYCEKASHKGIIIGKGGNMLKKIGTYARQDMEAFFQCRVNLNLWVKVKEDWRNRERMLQSFGFDSNDFL
ncbi:MAG: GTPase Era [Clostridia bacterium]|nr:GTPase Era [Clostridia bacterium]